jgi:hypothetical protein
MRGRFDLCKTLIRQRIKGNRSTRGQDVEPNFHSMPYCKDDDYDDAILHVAEMGPGNHSIADKDKSHMRLLSHDHGMCSDRDENDDKSTHVSVPPCSKFMIKGDVKQISDTSQPLLVHRVPSLSVRHDELMLHNQFSQQNEEANRRVRFDTSECLQEESCSEEPYPIQYLPFEQHTPHQKRGMSNHTPEQASYYHHYPSPHHDHSYVDEDETYETAVTQLSMRQADTLQRMQTLQKLHQLKRNLGQAVESSSSFPSRHYATIPRYAVTSASLKTTEQSMVDSNDIDDPMTASHHKSHCYDGLMNPNTSENKGFSFPEDDSCSSVSDGSSIITAKGHTSALVYSTRLHQQPQLQLQLQHSVQLPVSIPECFAGRIFHSLDASDNDEISCICQF